MKRKNIPHRQTASIKTLTALCCLLLLTVCLPVRAQGERIILGNERTSEYYPLLRGKRVALFGNHTSLRGDQHLLDCLLADSIRVVAVFSPEHGFRGNADAGEKLNAEGGSPAPVSPPRPSADGQVFHAVVCLNFPAASGTGGFQECSRFLTP